MPKLSPPATSGGHSLRLPTVSHARESDCSASRSGDPPAPPCAAQHAGRRAHAGTCLHACSVTHRADDGGARGPAPGRPPRWRSRGACWPRRPWRAWSSSCCARRRAGASWRSGSTRRARAARAPRVRADQPLTFCSAARSRPGNVCEGLLAPCVQCAAGWAPSHIP